MNMRILIADDDPITSEILYETLIQWGFEVVRATNGSEAWQILQEKNAPNLVLLDWMMPGMTGLDVCRMARQQQHKSYVYILLLTSKAERTDIIKGLDAGADDYIVKPYDLKELDVRLSVGFRILSLEEQRVNLLSKLREKEQARHRLNSNLIANLNEPLAATKQILESFQSHREGLNPKLIDLLDNLVQINEEGLAIVNQVQASYQEQDETSPLLIKSSVNEGSTDGEEDPFVQLRQLLESSQF